MVYFLLILGLVILLAGGKYLVDGASDLASFFGLSQGLIGLTIVAFGTSAPELLVSVNAALKGSSDIALGNVVGSNISNISLVLGISAILYPIVIHKSILKLDYLATLISSILFFILALNGFISRVEGGVFLVLLIMLNYYFFRTLSKSDTDESDNPKNHSIFKAVIFLIIGVLGLYFGSDLFVDNAVVISENFGISERVIGVTVIAIGTSLPELVTSVIAAINRKTDIAIGNILGSNIMNILAIIGVTSLISPIAVSEEFIKNDFIWMIGFTILLFPILRSAHNISRIEGGGLVLLYFIYIYMLL
ncbi:Inner membrane protein YrbG, predicted calcium/sodium:proton antiporter [Indibacter alkaliphilus LW1]|uniref:Inner membrane protein YrbG, predicted calcium/sodium:proton antiporter n=1 Tax=Indibacter alkaliphilus (strain CCUG 57479 / KCTC 22604 / LW1) TaxID=1189612 RepID=S2E547_INDAL|nr:calcium/sodium antiporter [Indibacter alkaliphilus]EOZ99716.1 Inner membrane protein YrbG, predicted calcium/sodium:proton antiporter [Indibacter alkaliphilus LW1]